MLGEAKRVERAGVPCLEPTGHQQEAEKPGASLFSSPSLFSSIGSVRNEEKQDRISHG